MTNDEEHFMYCEFKHEPAAANAPRRWQSGAYLARPCHRWLAALTASARAAGPAPSAPTNPATHLATHAAIHAPSSPATQEAWLSRERERSKIYENLHRAILGVIRDYPGLEDRISDAIRPFEEHPVWNN